MINMLITGIAVVVVFSLMILAHEMGHFVAAKRAGVKVEEFGIGYPPRLLTVAKRGDTEFTINAIPVGGFVRMLGEEDPQAPGSLASKSRPWRALVLCAGSMMNIVLAVVLLSAVYIMGTLTPDESQPGTGIYEVVAGSPAAEAGLRVGDTVISVDGRAIEDYEALSEYTRSHLGEQMTLVVRRGSETLSVQLTPRVDPPEGEGPMGIRIGPPLVVKSYPCLLYTSDAADE